VISMIKILMNNRVKKMKMLKKSKKI